VARRPHVRIALAVALVSATLIASPGARAAVVGGTNGADALSGTNQADVMNGAGGSDTLFGKRGADKLFGGPGNDTLFGGGGTDVLDGGEQNDVIYDDDSSGGDKLRGRSGNDTLFSIDGAADRVNCGAGIDTAFVDRRKDVVADCETVIRRGGDRGSFRVSIGSNGTDFIETGSVRNLIFARAGRDFIRAGEDDDILLGGGDGDFFRGEGDDDVHIDDDSQRGDSHTPGDGRDIVFTVDGARDSVDCSNDGDDGDDDIVFADSKDAVIDCGTVFRG
jgi:Ca2+-binding RTX toxin-like protein